MAATQATSQDFAKGYAAYQAGDYQTAFKEWAPLAEQRDMYAQYNLGLLYNNGEYVPQGNAEAVKMVPLGCESMCCVFPIPSWYGIRQRVGRSNGPQKSIYVGHDRICQ